MKKSPKLLQSIDLKFNALLQSSKQGSLRGSSRLWLVLGAMLCCFIVVPQFLGLIASRFEWSGDETTVPDGRTLMVEDESEESALARLDLSIGSKSSLDAVMATNEALKAALAEIEEIHERVQRKITILQATNHRRDAILEQALLEWQVKDNSTDSSQSTGSSVLTPDDEALSKEDLDQIAPKKALEILPLCLSLRDDYADFIKDLTRKWHVWLSALRERRLRRHTCGRIKELHADRDWWRTMNLSSGPDALAKLKTLPPGQDMDKLNNILMKYLPNENVFDWNDPDPVAKADAWVKESEEHHDQVEKEKNEGQKQAVKREEEIRGFCGIQVYPSWNWTAVHDEICKNFSDESASLHPKGYSDCIDWSTFDPTYHDRVGIRAPDPLWKEDPKLYINPTVNVTFVLQYFRQPELITTIVDRLYRCTEGKSGKGQFPGVTTTLLVNVDQAEEFQTWYDTWKKTDEGLFLVPVFSHNIHESRGFNNLANAARGEFLVFMQDNDVPPENCSWLDQALKVFSAWPRVGAVGLRNDKVSAQKFDRAGILGDLQLQGSKEYTPKKLLDPEIGVHMHFASVADVGPLVILKDIFQSLGGFHEGFCKKGNPCSLADWQLTFRVWLAGHQVVHVELEDKLSFSAGPNLMAPGSQEIATALQNVEVNLAASTEIFKDYREHVVKEVKRMNSHLPQAQEGSS